MGNTKKINIFSKAVDSAGKALAGSIKTKGGNSLLDQINARKKALKNQ